MEDYYIAQFFCWREIILLNLEIDIETFSSVNLAKAGVYRYAESPDFEVLLFGYSVDGGEVKVGDLVKGEKIPEEVMSALEDEAVTKWAFNAQFERICISRMLGYEAGTYLVPASWKCSMVWSAYMGLPLSLEGVGAVLGLEKQKLTEPDVSELLKYDGARTIKMRPWSAYTRTTQFQIENEKVTLTVSIGQTAETNNAENRGAYNLGKVYTFFRFSFENAQGFEKMEKYYIIARKIVAILTSQNNICFEEVYLSQRNSEQKYFKTGICKIFDSYENYSIRQWHKVIPIFSVFDYIPNLIDGIVNGKVNSLLELLPEDNKMVNRISIKNVQDLCTALEVSYQLDDKRKREKDALIEELKKNIKNTIAEFTKAHNEIDVNKETTMSSAFQYLDYTLKQKILTLYNENSDIVDEIVSKYSLPSVNENSIASFVKLRNNKTHSGTVEWGESAKIYTPLFAIVYASFFKYIKLPDEVIKSTLLQIF